MTSRTKTNLGDLVTIAAELRPDAVALAFREESVSYGQLRARMCGFAAGLRALGVARSDRVAVFLEKRIETVVAIFGTAEAGAIFVPVNPLLKPAQVAHILRDCDVSVLVISPERLDQLLPELQDCPALRCVVEVADTGLDRSPSNGGVRHLRWEELPAAGMGNRSAPATVDSDIAAILYTSGSTGKPKGVVLTHRNLIVGAESVSQYLENTSDDVILSALPLSFDAGLSQLTTAFNVGAQAVLLNYVFPGDVAKACQRHGVTGITGVPPFWIQIADQPWPEAAAARLRYFANTGGRMPKATLDKLRQTFPRALPYLMYGLTEAFRSTYLPPSEVDRRPDSIGKAIPNAEILVIRPDGTLCAPGEEGELVHRGPLVTRGYWNDPVRTAERFRPAPLQPEGVAADLAVYSGDTVVTDEEGFLYFVGRHDEMIKTSGYRVSPTEIEEAAYSTGMVRDAVALGMDDDALGQRIVLVASPVNGAALDTERLLTDMRRRLPLYMIPSRVVDMAALPTSPNGKFDRVLLRQQVASR